MTELGRLDPAKVTDAFNKQAAEIARLRKLIKDAEWEGQKDDVLPRGNPLRKNRCPWCGEWNEDGYAPDCPAFGKDTP